MITKMKKYTFLVFHKEYDEFLRELREAGVVHIAQKEVGTADDEQLQEQIVLADKLRKTISDLSAYLVEGAVGADTVGLKSAEQLMQEFAKLVSEKQQLADSIANVEKERSRMKVWGDFDDRKMKALKEEGYLLEYFVCPKSKYDEEWETLYNAVVVAEEGGQVYFVCVGKTNEAFSIDAEQVVLNEHSARQLSSDIEALNGLLAAKQAQLEAFALANINSLKKALYQTERLIDWTGVKLNTSSIVDDKLCLLEGFCPIDNADNLDSMLDKRHVYYTKEDPTEEDDTPIKLHNNWFTRMFECLTGMYGWPVYGEADPTPILAPFFLLFFAMCMGDAGYGILLILFGILTTKKVLNISMFEGLGPLITTLGIGTLVVGFFLGTFFGIDLYNAAWVPDSLKSVMIKGEVMGYDIQMVLALCIGVFHICLAMTVKAIIYTKRFGFKQNISTWGWLLFILGALITGILAISNVFSVEVAKWVLIVIGIISAFGIYIFNTPGRNPLINIGAGLWDTYNMATGILGDVLSYIRLYALGLAGGMLGGAFNNLAQMVLGETPNVGSWIGFILILIVGHLLNVAMSALGAFVHPLRLSFVEYFKNSGYEGKGKLYEPFKN